MSDGAGTVLELFVRSLSPEGARSSVPRALDRVADLAEQGAVADYAVRVCGRRLPATPAAARTAFGSYVLNRVAVFRQWADRNGLSLDCFERRRVRSSLTGEDRQVLIVPVMILAEYDGDALRFVAPCTADDGAWTVPDRLDELPAGAPATVDPLPHARASPPDTGAASEAEFEGRF